MDVALQDYFRCPQEFANVDASCDLSSKADFFQFGQDVTCYGRYTNGSPFHTDGQVTDTLCRARFERGHVELPFELAQVVTNLRYERYASDLCVSLDGMTDSSPARQCYYLLRPFLPLRLRKHVQRARPPRMGGNHVSALAGRFHSGIVDGARAGLAVEEPGNDTYPLHLVLA